MKPKILHLLDDHSVGGVTKTTHCISNSRLSDQFELKLVKSNNVLSVLRAENPDVLVFHNPSSWRRSFCLPLIKRYARKVIIHEHHYSAGFEQYNVSNLIRFHSMLKLSYGLANRVVAISQAQQNWIQQNRLVSPSKVTMIRQCHLLDRFLSIPYKKIQQPLILAAYGRFCDQKGFDILLQAMRTISDLNIQLNLGGYGKDEILLKQLAEGHENIKFWGAIQDVPAFLTAADVVVIPSRWEPWGNVCVEAKAASKPVIASSIDGLSEQVQGCGILVEPDNPQQLAMAIRSMANLSTETLEGWGKAGRDSVERSWEIYLNAWETLLWQVLES
jgi:glycosyltransferase involved in cell wall biosynthesis